MIETLPPYLGILSTILIGGLLFYRLVNKTLKLQSELEDYIITTLVLLTVVSGTAMRLLPPESFNPIKIEFLPDIILRIEKTPNIPFFYFISYLPSFS